MSNVGVLSFHNSKETKAILNAVEQLGHEPYWLRSGEFELSVRDGQTALSPDVDVVINRLLLSTESRPSELLGVASAITPCVTMMNQTDAVFRSLHKPTALARLQETVSRTDMLQIPDSLVTTRSESIRRFIQDNSSIHKRAIGTHGNNADIVETGEPAPVLRTESSYSMLQDRVAQSEPATDVRAYAVGDTVVASMQRTAGGDTWKTNIARGGTATQTHLSAETRDAISAVVSEIGLDYAGVDIMKGTDGMWNLLEVNPTAGFKGLYRATQTSMAPFIVAQALRSINVDVDDDRVEELSATLDDSIPDAASNMTREKTTIGLTESVAVGGRSATKHVAAKVDTGAARTSIDTELAAAIQAGPIRETVSVRTTGTDDATTRPVVPVRVRVNGQDHTLDVSVADRTQMEYPVILGLDILSRFRIDPSKHVHGRDRAEE